MENRLLPSLNISLFGSLQIQHSIYGEIKESRRKVQALLAWLLLEADQPHGREQLVALLWSEMNRQDGLRNLRVTLSRMRKHLAAPASLEASRAEIILHSSDQHLIDVVYFETLIKKSTHHEHRSLADCTRCLADLQTAVNLYKGDFLAGFHLEENKAFEEWVFVWRERLHLLALSQMGRLAEAEIANGRYHAAEALARRQINLDPLQEPAHRQLMSILAQTGRRSQALRQYQTCAERLKIELGIPPDGETKALKDQIKVGAFKSTKKEAIKPKSRTNAKDAQTSKLPQIGTPFIGREEELTLLAERLAQKKYRLISLVGPGGIGKTRLAIRAGQRAVDQFKDGVYFVPLVGVRSHADIPAAIADATGALLTSDDLAPAAQIAHFLHRREILLIIDNLEHIIDGADMLLNWIEKAPNLTLLVTSRERINAQVEDLFRLNGLPYPKDEYDLDAVSYEAVRLFGDRAHRLDKRFWLNEDTLPSVIRICQQVEGLPLALELAATSIREFNVAEIAASLGKDSALLATTLRDVPSRHRQFELVFEHSWRLLSTTEQAILARLSIFRGGFSRSAAAQVAAGSTLSLTHLRYKSLIRADGNGRLTMHELLRQMANVQLQRSPTEAAEAKQAHANYYLTLVQEKSPLLVGSAAAATTQELRIEIDNIRAAWQTAVSHLDTHSIQETVSSLVDFYSHIGLNFEMEKLIDQIFPAYKQAGKQLENDLKILLKLKKIELLSLYATVDQFEPQMDAFLNLLQTHSSLNQNIDEAKARYYYSIVLSTGNDAKKATAQCDLALDLAKQADDPIHLGYVLCLRAYYFYRASQFKNALEVLDTALAIFEPLGHLKGQSLVEDRLAPTYAENGNYWKGLIHDKKALDLYQQLGYEQKVPKGHQGIAFSYILLGAYDLAKWHMHQSIDLDRKLGNDLGVMASLSGLAEIECLEGRFQESKQLYRQCLQRRRADGDYQSFCVEAVNMVRCLWQTKELEEAQKLIEEVIQWLIKFENDVDMYTAQTIQALIYWEQGKQEQALQLLEKVHPQIDPYSLEEPVKTLYEMYTVFYQANHPTAAIVIRQAYDVMRHIAKEITDPEMLHSFLNNVSYCAWLREAFELYQLPKLIIPA